MSVATVEDAWHAETVRQIGRFHLPNVCKYLIAMRTGMDSGSAKRPRRVPLFFALGRNALTLALHRSDVSWARQLSL
jgi:hypothetical protein